MKVGVTASSIAHVSLIALALVGLGAARPLEPAVIESIAVELVPISDVTNIRMGSLESEVVETDTPAIVETETPAELAQPTGNTTENQVTPTEAERETPAPVVNTAPEPIPEPTPEPVPEPEPVVEQPPPPAPEPAEPEPAPVEEAPPAEIVAETPAEEAPPQRAAPPVPMMRSAAVMRAPSPRPPETRTASQQPPPTQRPAEAQAPREQQQRPRDEAARVADQVAALINNETSRGATTGQGGSPTLGRNDGRSSTLSQSQLDGLVAQIKGCMNIPAGSAEAGITAQLMFSIDGGGNVNATPQIVSATATALERALASAAQRAVMRCGPYMMAANQDVRATFDPRELY